MQPSSTEHLRTAFDAFRVSQRNAGHFDRDPVSDIAALFASPLAHAAAVDMIELLRASNTLPAPARDLTVLDVGCSTGVFACALAPYVRRVVGIDIEPEAVAVADAWRAHNDLRSVSFVCGDAGNLATLDAALPTTFDVIVLKDVIEHLGSRQAIETVLLQLRALLARGGVIYVEAPNYLVPFEPHVRIPMLPLSPVSLIRRTAQLLGKRGASDESFYRTLTIVAPWTFEAIARRAGFSIVDLAATLKLPGFLYGTRPCSSTYRWASPLLGLVRRAHLAPVIGGVMRFFRLYPTLAYVLR